VQPGRDLGVGGDDILLLMGIGGPVIQLRQAVAIGTQQQAPLPVGDGDLWGVLALPLRQVGAGEGSAAGPWSGRAAREGARRRPARGGSASRRDVRPKVTGHQAG